MEDRERKKIDTHITIIYLIINHRLSKVNEYSFFCHILTIILFPRKNATLPNFSTTYIENTIIIRYIL